MMTMKKETKQRKITVWFKSRTSDALYKTERHRNGKTSCFCPGAVYNGTCWHQKRVSQYKI